MGTEASERSENAGETAASTPGLVALQCLAATAGTLIGASLGTTLPGKLAAGLLVTTTAAFLTAPGRHHRRRIVAVALFVALLGALRRAPDALAADRTRNAWAPASWAAVGLTAAAGFAIGGAITTARGGWTDGPPTAAVPDVRGRPRAVALVALEETGFASTTEDEPSARIARGSATRTDPPAGATLDEGSDITLFVSSGLHVGPIRGPRRRSVGQTGRYGIEVRPASDRRVSYRWSVSGGARMTSDESARAAGLEFTAAGSVRLSVVVAAGDLRVPRGTDIVVAQTPSSEDVDVDGDGSERPADCDDADSRIHPEATDTPGDGIDQDCDGRDATLPPAGDADEDRFDTPADCDDQNARINPDAREIPGNGIDEDCAGGDATPEP